MKIVEYLMRTKDGLISVRSEDLNDFAKAQQAIKEGKLPRRTSEELEAMKKQVLTRSARQK